MMLLQIVVRKIVIVFMDFFLVNNHWVADFDDENLGAMILDVLMLEDSVVVSDFHNFAFAFNVNAFCGVECFVNC
jgi:hypothetical protein